MKEITWTSNDDMGDSLDIPTNTIINITDVGRVRGRKQGFEIEGNNLKNILRDRCDQVTWYCDAYDLRAITGHYDGGSHYLYRELKREEDRDIVINHLWGDKLTPRLMSKYTKSLLPRIKEALKLKRICNKQRIF